VMSGRVLCVTVASASGHVIVERFYERLPETTQMQWRRRLHEASSGSLGHGGASTLSGNDFARVEEVCGVSHQGEDCMVWCGVGDIRFYAVGSGQYDELALAEVLQTLATAIAAMTKKRFDEPHVFEHFGMICLALDDVVVDGHVESISWDQIRRTAKMKLAAE